VATKLVLDTDIGTDVDDAWALALCLASPEIDLLGVTLVHADLETRAKIALKMLNLAGRLDVPVYKGLSETLTQGGRIYWVGHEGTETDFSDIDNLSAKEGAVDFITESAELYPGELVICSIGPMTNIGEAISRNLGAMQKVKMLVIMGTTYRGEGRDAAAPEHNAIVDPKATKIVMESGIPALVVGLNVTTKVVVCESDLKLIEHSPLGKYLAAMTRQYYRIRRRDFTYMHDPLAVAAIVDRSVVKTRKMVAEVLDDGRVAYTHTTDGTLDVCVDVDVDAFENMLTSRICSIVRKGD
jgi:purine nucleosidase